MCIVSILPGTRWGIPWGYTIRGLPCNMHFLTENQLLVLHRLRRKTPLRRDFWRVKYRTIPFRFPDFFNKRFLGNKYVYRYVYGFKPTQIGSASFPVWAEKNDSWLDQSFVRSRGRRHPRCWKKRRHRALGSGIFQRVLMVVSLVNHICWWFRNPVNSPVEVGSLSHYLQAFLLPGGAGFLNHQQYLHFISTIFLFLYFETSYL